MKEVISTKYGWNTIAWAKIIHSGTYIQVHAIIKTSSKLTRCQNPYQLQNLKILLKFQGHKNPHRWIVWNFLCEKKRLYRYYQNKNQLGVISSSYINLTMKLLIKSYVLAQKQCKSEIFMIFGTLFVTFSLT